MNDKMKELKVPPVREYSGVVSRWWCKLYACKNDCRLVRLMKEDFIDGVFDIVKPVISSKWQMAHRYIYLKNYPAQFW